MGAVTSTYRRNRLGKWRPATGALLILAAAALSIRAAGPGINGTPAFPDNPSNWINSPPITLEVLQGKAAFLWFFEEGCPRCRANWPSLLAAAEKFSGKPIVFIAVNSGSSRQDIEQYAREVRLSWPVLVDPTREYEKACGVGEISLQDIMQARIITADGRMEQGNWSEIDGTINTALKGAAWKVDPASIPTALREAWLQVETGKYGLAAAAIKKGAASNKSDVKQGAEKLLAVIQGEMATQLKTAKTNGDKWATFKAYAAVAERFKGCELPAEAAATYKELAKDSSVKETMQAMKNVDIARGLLESPNPTKRRLGATMLDKVIKGNANAHAVAAAQSLLQQAAK